RTMSTMNSFPDTLSRRELFALAASPLVAPYMRAFSSGDPIIDIHQHTNYHGRTDEQLIAHQTAMGVTRTILLPAGRSVDRPSTDNGRSNGLAARTGGNESCLALSRKYPKQF